MSPKFVPKGSINNIPALVDIMAWRRPGNKPLSETMAVRLSMHVSLGLNELSTVAWGKILSWLAPVAHLHYMLFYYNICIWLNHQIQ